MTGRKVVTLQSKDTDNHIAAKDSGKITDFMPWHVLMVRFTSWANRNSSWNYAHRMHISGDRRSQCEN